MKLVYTDEAIENLKRLREFIAIHNPSAATRIATELVGKIELLVNFLRIGTAVQMALVPDSVRDMFLTNMSFDTPFMPVQSSFFGYGIAWKVNGNNLTSACCRARFRCASSERQMRALYALKANDKNTHSCLNSVARLLISVPAQVWKVWNCRPAMRRPKKPFVGSVEWPPTNGLKTKSALTLSAPRR